MTSLAALPAELILDIVSILAEESPPSKRFLHQEPSNLILSSDHRPLKSLSQTCRLLHDLCSPSLFEASKINAEDIAKFLSFIRTHDLSENVTSLIIWSNTSEYGTSTRNFRWSNPTKTRSILAWRDVTALLDAIHPRSLTFVLPPATFRCLVPYDYDMADAWVFNPKYHVLRLEQTPDPQNASLARRATNQNIFSLRPWAHMTFNEGSSIPAYSSYEYHHKIMPAPLRPSECDFSTPMGAWGSISTFDFVGVFPIGYLSSVSFCIYNMHNLQCLRVRLAPVSSRTMDDTEGLGKCQRSDLWLEFESAYGRVTQLILQPQDHRHSKLRKFVALDYAQHSLRVMIDSAVHLGEGGWHHDYAGTWTRP